MTVRIAPRVSVSVLLVVGVAVVVAARLLRPDTAVRAHDTVKPPVAFEVLEELNGKSVGGPWEDEDALEREAPTVRNNSPRIGPDPTAELQRRPLQLPIRGAKVEAMRGGFTQGRDGNRRRHEAVDILAPRNTSIHAVEAGTIAKLFVSKAGGVTVYQYDPTKRYCYYYAHLERYADGLQEGDTIAAGEVIGYVGTTGNAPESAPHLHFAIFKLGSDQRWWEGTAVDPYYVFSIRG